jgi:hypothetical protein
LNLNLECFYSFTFIFVSCRESCLLVSWCLGDWCDMMVNDENHRRSRRPGAEDREWSSMSLVLSSQTIKKSDDIVCGLQHAREDKEHGFFR